MKQKWGTMKNLTYKILLCTFLFVQLFSKTRAQEVISVAGNHAQNETFQISWTMGEPVIETVSSSSIVLTQGMHQSKLIVTSIKDLVTNFEIKAYPNPVKTNLNLYIDKNDVSGFEYRLFNAQGKLVQVKKVLSNKTEIQFQNFRPAGYLLQVNNGNRALKTFKVVKLE